MNILCRLIRKLYRVCCEMKGKGPSNMDIYADIDSSTINRGATIRLDNPKQGKKYLNIGENTIFAGQYIFESTEGYISIGNHCFINDSMFISRNAIEIGNNVTIAWGCTVYDHDSHSLDFMERRKDIDRELIAIRDGINSNANKDWSVVNSAPIKICDDAWIGMDCLILKGVTIGKGCVVAARSVVTKNTPPYSVVAGCPAKVVKYLK